MYITNDIINNQFEVIKTFSGGMGIVYICNDIHDNKIIALKTMKENIFSSFQGLENFIAESSIWISLGYHPNIVHANKIIEIEGRPFIQMEYINSDNQFGPSLRGLLLSNQLSISNIIEICIQICDGMIFVNNNFPGLIHRDLKPENILINNDFVVKITDFGLIKLFTEEVTIENDTLDYFQVGITNHNGIVGTPPYMSPEQCLGKKIDNRSDIYSLGCILYELLTGRWIFNCNDPNKWIDLHVSKTPREPQYYNKNISESMNKLIMKCLKKNPNNRYENFDQLRKDLEIEYFNENNSNYQHIQRNKNLNNLNQLFEISQSHLLVGNYSKAEEILLHLYEKKPYNHDILHSLMRVYLETYKIDKAEIFCKKALKAMPNSVRTLINYGALYIIKNDLIKGKEIIEKSIELDPNRFQSWNNLGIIYLKLGKYHKAKECFINSLNISPWQSEAWLNISFIYKQLGSDKKRKDALKNGFNYSFTHNQRLRYIDYLIEADIELSQNDINSILRSAKKYFPKIDDNSIINIELINLINYSKQFKAEEIPNYSHFTVIIIQIRLIIYTYFKKIKIKHFAKIKRCLLTH